MLRKLEFAKKMISIEDYDDARAALMQALALAKLMAVSGKVVDDPDCICTTAGLLEELLERIEQRLESAASA